MPRRLRPRRPFVFVFQARRGRSDCSTSKTCIDSTALATWRSPRWKSAVFVRQWIDPATKDRAVAMADRGRRREAGRDGGRRAGRPRAGLLAGRQVGRVPVHAAAARRVEADAAGAARVRPRDRHLADAGGRRNADPARRAGQALRPRVQRRLLRPARVLAGRHEDSPSSPTTAATRARRPRRPNGVRVVRDDQGEGYTGYGPARSGSPTSTRTPRSSRATKIERLTNDDVWYGDPQWSPDGKTLVVHANRTADRESVRFSINKNFDLWLIDVATEEISAADDGPGPEVSPAVLARRQADRLPERAAKGLAPRRVQPRGRRPRGSRAAGIVRLYRPPPRAASRRTR